MDKHEVFEGLYEKLFSQIARMDENREWFSGKGISDDEYAAARESLIVEITALRLNYYASEGMAETKIKIHQQLNSDRSWSGGIDEPVEEESALPVFDVKEAIIKNSGKFSLGFDYNESFVAVSLCHKDDISGLMTHMGTTQLPINSHFKHVSSKTVETIMSTLEELLNTKTKKDKK